MEGEDGNGGADNKADSDGDSSPIPTVARRLQKPQVQFVFDNITGDFNPYPTIFLPRLVVPPAQGTKSVTTKKKKKTDPKSKDKLTSTSVPHKRPRDDDDNAPVIAKPASKKQKSNDCKVSGDKGMKISGVSIILANFL